MEPFTLSSGYLLTPKDCKILDDTMRVALKTFTINNGNYNENPKFIIINNQDRVKQLRKIFDEILNQLMEQHVVGFTSLENVDRFLIFRHYLTPYKSTDAIKI